jgi:purine-binding chemotaxis protein CheW
MKGGNMKLEAGKDKVKLPQSGLADEVLDQEKDQEDKSVAVQEPPTGPDQIYTFADQLKNDDRQIMEQKEEENLETWVSFSLGNESFGLPVSNVQEILRAGSITRVPHAPHSVRGVANMRGRVLPVVDLRVRLGIEEGLLSPLSRILVVETKGRLIGLLVDAVQQVIRLNKKAMQPPPPDIMTNQSDYILGVYHLQDALVILLDVNRVLLMKDSLQN